MLETNEETAAVTLIVAMRVDNERSAATIGVNQILCCWRPASPGDFSVSGLVLHLTTDLHQTPGRPRHICRDGRHQPASQPAEETDETKYDSFILSQHVIPPLVSA